MNYYQLTIQRSKTVAWFLLFIATYTFIGCYGLSKYVNLYSINFILGSLAICSSITIGGTDRRPVLFAVLSIVFAVLYLVIPAKTFLFAAVSIAVFFLIEIFVGKINSLTIFSLVCMCPIFEYVTNVFSFPVRLFLTAIAGKMISVVNPGTIIEGNVIINGSSEFAVDPACMGLHMLITSLLASLIITSIIQKKRDSQVSTKGLLIIIISVFILNIISNLFRIICLVYFEIQPESSLHSVMGMTCFLTYVILPVLYIIKYVVKRFTERQSGGEKVNPASFNIILINIVLIILMGMGAYMNKDSSVNKNIVINKPVLQGYKITDLPDSITKVENDKALIYMKPIAGFYSSDHHPMICWTGSGYQFKKIREKRIGGHTVYTAVLEKGNDVLYSAWWYENSRDKTISQLQWRWNWMTGGDRYSLVNVTVLNAADLDKEVNKLFSLDPFQKVLASK